MTQFTCKGVKQINNRISLNITFTFTIRISRHFSSAQEFQMGNFQKYWSQNACEPSGGSIFLPILRIPSIPPVNFQNLPPMKKIKYKKILTYILQSIFLEIPNLELPHWRKIYFMYLKQVNGFYLFSWSVCWNRKTNVILVTIKRKYV
jgi:hypothetical protein